MIEIKEKYILTMIIARGIRIATAKFKKINKFRIRQIPIVYTDILEEIQKSVEYYNVFDNEIDIIYLDSKSIDDNLLNMLLNLLKAETYTCGLRIIKDSNNNFLYVYMDKVYNKNIYYVDDTKTKDQVKKSLGYIY